MIKFYRTETQKRNKENPSTGKILKLTLDRDGRGVAMVGTDEGDIVLVRTELITLVQEETKVEKQPITGPNSKPVKPITPVAKVDNKTE